MYLTGGLENIKIHNLRAATIELLKLPRIWKVDFEKIY